MSKEGDREVGRRVEGDREVEGDTELGRVEGDLELGRREGSHEVGALEGIGHPRNCVQVPLQLISTFSQMSVVASMRVRLLSPLNASEAMVITVGKITTVFNIEQRANALEPMDTTDLVHTTCIYNYE